MEHSYSPDHDSAQSSWTTTTKLVVVFFTIILLGLAAYAFRVILVPLIISGVMAFVLHPLVQVVSRFTRIPHGLATAFIYLILLAGVTVLVIFIAPVVVDQVNFLQTELVETINLLLSLSNESIVILDFEVEVQSIVDEVAVALQEFARSFATDIVFIAFDVAEILLLTIFVFLMAFYMTRDADKILLWIRGLVPPGYKQDSDRLLAEIDTVWTSFFRGQLILALVVTVIITVLATILGLPRPLLWGVFAGFMELLPSVGHAIWIVSALLAAIIGGSTSLPISNLAFALVVGISHVVFTQFDLNFLIPRIIGRQVHLHPMVIIIGIIVGASVGGVLGVALAAPVIASLRVIGRYVYARLFGIEAFPERSVINPPDGTEELPEVEQADEAMAQTQEGTA